jgi:hypothetical protein
MGGGDGHVIVDNAIQSVLTNPVVHGVLPPKHQTAIDLFINTDPGTWTDVQRTESFKAFEWAHKNL